MRDIDPQIFEQLARERAAKLANPQPRQEHLGRFQSHANRWERVKSDNEYAIEEENRHAALARDRRDRLTFLTDERTDLDGWFDRLAEGRSPA